MHLLNIYRIRLNLALATLMQYRASLVIWLLGLVVEPIIYMAVWTQVTRETGSVQGYSAGDFAAYYLAWMLVRHFTVAINPNTIERRVRRGEFSQMLLLPVHPIHMDVADVFGFKLVALPAVLLTLVLLALVFPPTLALQWWSIPAFILALLLAFPIRFLFSWLLGLVAFWTTWARSIYGVFVVAEIFLTGRLAPLSLLPGWVLIVASALPFRWMISFPVEVLLGKLTLEEVVLGFAVQGIMLTVLALMLAAIWPAAVERYTAVGA
jgi:ABC-2 type transport system permease protein